MSNMPTMLTTTVICVQVELITRHPPCGGYVNIHRYMAAGSCIGVEVWQGPGLLGCPLEQQLTSLVPTICKPKFCLKCGLVWVLCITIGFLDNMHSRLLKGLPVPAAPQGVPPGLHATPNMLMSCVFVK